jgi:hypothetical protein
VKKLLLGRTPRAAHRSGFICDKQASRESAMRLLAITAFAGFFFFAHVPLHAQASPPAAPSVTVGANLKELTFDWAPVPGAYTYWLLEKKNATAPFVRIGQRIPGSRTRAAVFVAVHLHDWMNTRYAVAACNLAGCTLSAAIDPSRLRTDTIGYFKASNTEPVGDDRGGDVFGAAIAMSSDGSTLVVNAPGERSNATGVNGNQANNDSPGSGALYVFRRNFRRWSQEAYLKAGVNVPGQRFGGGQAAGGGRGVTISGDGSWLAASATETVDGLYHAGKVYLFHRAADGTWSLHGALTAPVPRAYHYFGYSVDLSEDGRLLKVSAALGFDEFENGLSEIHFFERGDTTWSHAGSWTSPYDGVNCGNSRLSGDGTTLAAFCQSLYAYPYDRAITLKRIAGTWTLVHEMPVGVNNGWQPVALDHHATRLALVEGTNGMNVIVYRWENHAWVRELDLPSQSSSPATSWGWAVSFSRNGKLMAVGDIERQVVGVYERAWSRAPWRLRSLLRDFGDYFGISMAMSGNGRYLAVGAHTEDSNARGIDGNRLNDDSRDAGAVYLY